jgi:AcrR family transcriptional regulator
VTEPATQRRQLQHDLNRGLILDAAERLFAERGYAGASLREIASRSGFSTAALYLFFQNKEEIYLQVLLRRSEELLLAIEAAAQTSRPPLQRLHDIAAAHIDHCLRWPHWAHLVAHHQTMSQGSSLSVWQEHPEERIRRGFEQGMHIEAQVISEGQARGEIRSGDANALAHLFSIMVAAHMAIGAKPDGDATLSGLTIEELQDVLDAAFRAPTAAMPSESTVRVRRTSRGEST